MLNPSSSSDPSALEWQDATATSSIPQNHHSYNYTLVCVEEVGFLVSVSSCSCWLYCQVFIMSASGDYVPTEGGTEWPFLTISPNLRVLTTTGSEPGDKEQHEMDACRLHGGVVWAEQ